MGLEIGFHCAISMPAAAATPSGEIGRTSSPRLNPSDPALLMAASGEIDAIHIFGTDYPTADGTAVRDYIHVCDLCTAPWRRCRYLEDGRRKTALNLGTVRGYSVREISRFGRPRNRPRTG